MQLAKIRSKSRQERAVEEAGQVLPVVGQMLPESRLNAGDEQLCPAPPSDHLMLEDAHHVTAWQVPARSAGVARQTTGAAVFDPLAVIMAGREQGISSVVTEQIEERGDVEPLSQEEPFAEFLCFKLGDEEYGVNIMEIKEIIKPRELTEVPRISPFIDGVISLRGVIVPVFNMRKRIQLPESGQLQERVIIVRSAEELYGLRVDRVTDVVKIFDADREPTPAILDGVGRDFVAGIGRNGSRMVILLDIVRVVDSTLGEA